MGLEGLGEHKSRLIQEAIQQHSRIFPCADKTHLNDCFTNERDRLLLWFNTEDDSTHVIMTRI